MTTPENKKAYSRIKARRKLMAHLNVSEPFPANIHVHHKDRNPFNNDLDNLQLMSSSEHISLHSREYWATVDNKDTTKRLLNRLESLLVCFNTFGPSNNI